MSTPIVQFDRFEKSYGTIQAVLPLDLSIQAGECYALIGPNGGGKSTLIKALVGLHSPSSGRVLFAGKSVNKLTRRDKQRLSYLPQRVTMPERLTAREIVRLFAGLREVSNGEADTMLNYVGLEVDADRYARDYSGGMLQRLGLAVALLGDPDLLVLDEPTLNLDPIGRDRFRDAIQKRKSQGKTIIFTSHIIQDAERLADRVGILVEGKLVAEELVSEFREKINLETRVRVIMREANDVIKEAARIAGATAVDGTADILLFTAPPETRLGVIRAIERAGGEILEFHSEPPDWGSLIEHHIRIKGEEENE